MIADDLKQALYLKLKVGDKVKIVHVDCPNVTPGKTITPAMNVERTNDGLIAYCHRCECGGKFSLTGLSPIATLKLLKCLREAPSERVDLTLSEMVLPDDSVAVICNYEDRCSKWITTSNSKWNIILPYDVSLWLWTNGLSSVNHIINPIYWSAVHNRLIFPVYDDFNSLIGWIGRSVEKEYKTKGIPKYITRKKKGLQNRLYYVCDKLDNNVAGTIFVEDIMSAHVVNRATNMRTVALLTTHFDYETAKQFKDSRMILWLDGNMHTKSLKKVIRLRSLSVPISTILTDKDPKAYSEKDIQTKIGDV